MSPPIISPYKKWFAVKRVVQTFLGGPRLTGNFGIIFFQLVIYLIPVVVIVTVVESNNTLSWEWKALLAGVGIFLTDITLTFMIWILKQRKDANVVPDVSSESNRNSVDRESTTVNLFDEEEIVPSDGCFKSSTWKYIAANVNMTVSHFAAVLVSAVSTFLCVSILADDVYLTEWYHQVLKGFVIFTICNARYSSVINAPAELATFDAVKRKHIFYRTFYVALLAGINCAVLIVREHIKRENENNDSHHGHEFSTEGYHDVETDGTTSPSSTTTPPTEQTSSPCFALLLSLLPVLWLTGILPPLDSLFPWLLELILNGFGGKSIGYTYFGTTISLAIAVVCPLTTFILSQDRKITFLMECACSYLISCDTGSMPKLKASLCEDVPVKYFLQQLIKPAVTIICSLLSVFIVETAVTESESVPDREIYHPVLASLSIFLLLTTKVVQIFDLVHYGNTKGKKKSKKKSPSPLCLSIFTMWHGLLTIVLHVWLTLELTTEDLEVRLTKSAIDLLSHSLHELFPCVLAIRAYALAVTEPNNSTIIFFAAFIHQTYMAEKTKDFVIILFVISLMHSILKRLTQYLRMIIIFIYATFSSPLLERKYVALAAILSTPITVVALMASSILKGVTLVPLFTLPIFTVAFPRPQSFWKGVWFVRSCGRNETQKILPATSSVDWTIYADLAPFLMHAFAKRSEEMKIEFESGSCYMARYDDRLLFIRIISSGWKFLYAQVKGLEIQEQTSCHHQEAAWMDEIFERYLCSYKPAWKQRLLTVPLGIINSLQPKFCLSVPSYSESKSQLPNFLSKPGKQIFRDMFFRAFSYLWIKSNPAFQGESYRRTIATGVTLGRGNLPKMQSSSRLTDRSHSISRTNNGYWAANVNNFGVEQQQHHQHQPDRENQFHMANVGSDLNGNKARQIMRESTESIASSGSYRGTSAPMRHHPLLKDVSAANWQGSVSYPLIPGLPNLAVEESEIASTAGVFIPSTNENPTNEQQLPDIMQNMPISSPRVLSRQNSLAWDGLPQLWMKQCVGDAIPHNAVKARVERLCWKAWEIAFGTHDDLYEVDMARFYRREFAKNMRTAIIHEKPDFEDIAVKAFRYATKLTLDEIYASGMEIEESVIPGTMSRQSVDLPEPPSSALPKRTEEDEQNIFLQLSSFEKAYRFCPYDEVPYWINDKAKHIVSISADDDKNILRIFNYRSDGVEFAVGELNRMCVEGIWSTLNMELLYLTSDDDERYSIQHSKYLLRNICAQSAQTLGYPVYEATYRVNLFDFSLEQLSS